MAIDQFTQLVCMHPSKFKYRFYLLTAYMQNKDTANVLKVAQGIIDLKPKIPSQEVARYKGMASGIRMTFDQDLKNSATIQEKINNKQFNIKYN